MHNPALLCSRFQLYLRRRDMHTVASGAPRGSRVPGPVQLPTLFPPNVIREYAWRGIGILGQRYVEWTGYGQHS